MLRTLDVILIVIMTAVAAVTYSIKHRAEEKLAEVKKIESDIQLEKDTIALLKADWALLTQPNRLQTLVTNFQAQLPLVTTESTQLVRPEELPMLRSQLPVFDPADTDKDGKVTDKEARAYARKLLGESTDTITTGAVND